MRGLSVSFLCKKCLTAYRKLNAEAMRKYRREIKGRPKGNQKPIK